MIYIVLIWTGADYAPRAFSRVHKHYFTTAMSAEAWITKHKTEWPYAGYEYEVKSLTEGEP